MEGSCSKKTLLSIRRLLSQWLSVPPSETTRHLFQRYVVCLWRGNATLWLQWYLTPPPLIDSVVLSFSSCLFSFVSIICPSLLLCIWSCGFVVFLCLFLLSISHIAILCYCVIPKYTTLCYGTRHTTLYYTMLQLAHDHISLMKQHFLAQEGMAPQSNTFPWSCCDSLTIAAPLSLKQST